jgi:tRNA/rRNA methyltransferase
VATLDEALDGVTHLCATAMTPRDFGPPTLAPREHFTLRRWRRQGHRRGLSCLAPSALAWPMTTCTAATLPEHSHQPGLWFAQPGRGIQVIAYEWRMALGGFAVQPPPRSTRAAGRCPGQVAGMLAHWEQSLVDIGFLDPAAPKKLMPRLNQLFNRAQLTRRKSTSCVVLPKPCSKQPGAGKALDCISMNSRLLEQRNHVFPPPLRHPVHP